MFISQMDLMSIIAENYLTFLLLGGLVIMMITYRDVQLPATRNFKLIIVFLFVMTMAFSLERWAVLSPARVNMRTFSSVLHYILQPFVIYLEIMIIMPEESKHFQRRQFLLTLPLLINTVIYLAAPFAGHLVFWYDDNYWFHRGPFGVSIYIVTFFYLVFLFIWTVMFFRAKNKIIKDKRSSIILFFMSGMAILTGILEGLNLASGYIDEAFAFGVFLYYMYLITMHQAEMHADLARKEIELSQNKIELLRQQIRPHFIFNSLHIIKSLIRTDREKAIQSIEDFSDYLRANIDVITSDKLITFEEELAHTEAFVSLALADDSKNITVEYDIEERWFRLPPLTIEPMVENAIRHGIAGGGIVKLSTRRDDDIITIVISDNGTGFRDKGTEKEEKRTGTGIENVRTRLATQCSGTLDIKSDENGTEVTIKIPVKRQEKQE